VRPTRRRLCAGLLATLALPTGLARGRSGLVAVPEPLPAPDLSGTLLDGTAWDIAARRGRLVLVSFWAVWCAPCRVEMPALSRLHADWAGEAEVVAVNLGDDDVRIRRFLERIDAAALPVLSDLERRHAAPWHVQALPVAYAVDPSGMIRLAALGALDWDDAAIRRQLRAIA
jgi:thiol-disulfide isomerase/thioredoxin